MTAADRAKVFFAKARAAGARLDLNDLRGAAAMFQAADAAEGADLFRSLACPVCGAKLSTWQRKTGDFKCERGHASAALRAPPPRAAAPRPQATAPRPSLSSAGVGDLWIRGQIRPETHAQVRARLASLRAAGAKAVLMTVDSPGGDVEAALAVHDDLKALGLPVVAYVKQAHSAASVIALGAEHLVMEANGSLLLHRVSGGSGPEERRAFDARLALVYVEASPVEDPDHAVSGLLGGDQVMDGPAAARWGYVDEVGSTVQALAVASAFARGAPPFSARRAALAVRGG